MKILLVEDDEGVLKILQQLLISQHYLVECATDGWMGWKLAETFDYDLILLDWMLPQLDGISFCQRLRAQACATPDSSHPNCNTPIILLTAADSGTQRVLGLDAGADDYLVKPIDPEELLARIRAVLRRSSGVRSPILIWGNLSLNPDSCEVTCQNDRITLTAKEYEVLELLMRNPQRIFSQRYLLEQLWQTEEMPTENTVRSHIKSLRQKLNKAGAGDVIETVYGLGYRLKKLAAIEEQGLGREDWEAKGQVIQPGEISGADGEGAIQPAEFNLQNSLPAGLEAIWEKYRGQYDDRLQVIRDAIAALAEGNLDAVLQQQARQEAHTLIGSLGSFNLQQAAQLARELESHFKLPVLDSSQARSLTTLATTLSQMIQHVSPSGNEECTQCSVPSVLPEVQLKTQHSDVKPRETVQTDPKSEIQNPKLADSHIKPRETARTDLKSEIQNPKLDHQVLIVEDDLALATAIQTEAVQWGIESTIAPSPAAARSQMVEVLSDAIVLDLTFPGEEQGGLELLREWTSHYPAIPIIVFTAQEGLEERLAVARSGARMFLQKPIAAREVVRAIAQILQPVVPPAARLLLVDDDRAMLEHLQTLLRPWGFEVTLLSDPYQFWAVLEQTQPHLLILDIEMPNISGIDLCQVVRNDAQWGDLPILMLSVHRDEDTMTQVFIAGADDYISKPIVGPELIVRIANRLHRNHQPQVLSPVKTAYSPPLS